MEHWRKLYSSKEIQEFLDIDKNVYYNLLYQLGILERPASFKPASQKSETTTSEKTGRRGKPENNLPNAYEVQYYYQNIWSKLIDKKTGKVEIYNENFFTPIQGVALYYDVQVEGVSVDGGVIDVTALGIKPLGRKTVKIKALADAVANKTYSGKEIVCNLSYNLVNGFNNQVNQYALLQAGDQIAHEQFVLTPYKYINIDNVVNAKAENKVQIEDHEVYILLTAGNTQVTFTKHNGRLAHLDVDGIEMMQEGYELRPDFWRAPTDNDFGAGMQRSLRAWKNPQMRLTSFDYKPSGSNYVVTANYEFSIMPNQPRGRRPQQGEQAMPSQYQFSKSRSQVFLRLS